LDLFGQVRNYFQAAAEIKGEGATEDSTAMLRYENEYRNTYLVEQPNTDFAHVIVRQFFFDVYHQLVLRELQSSKNETLVAVANKSIKEVDYHVEFSSTWVKRLGDGTDESHSKMQEAVNTLWRYSMELFKPTDTELWAAETGVGPDLEKLKPAYLETVKEVLAEANLTIHEDTVFQYGAKTGMHSENMGFILAEFQYMQRAYPNMKW
jgi:ring-1,2-phenylacetyl-CoA epoxidase subunit PaaC